MPSLQRGPIVKYFYDIDKNIINVLDDDQKYKYGLIEPTNINQFIGTNKSCCINYDDILENDRYYQCDNKLHYFKEDSWKQWMRKRTDWLCPHCFSNVKTICYVNKS